MMLLILVFSLWLGYAFVAPLFCILGIYPKDEDLREQATKNDS